jgi:hypothetical protein
MKKVIFTVLFLAPMSSFATSYSASTQSQLFASLEKAKPGDEVVLEPGNYGHFALDGKSRPHFIFSGMVKIRSRSLTSRAVINGLELNHVRNIAISGVLFDYNTSKYTPKYLVRVIESSDIDFINNIHDGQLSGGYGSGVGLNLYRSENISVTNSDFKNFKAGIQIWTVDGVEVRGNDILNSRLDGMILLNVSNVLIENNHIVNRGDDADHKDLIQFGQKSGTPSSNVVIRGNLLESTDGTTHGIYAANEVALATNDLDSYYRNFKIENNEIYTGQKLALAIGHISGLTIRYNEARQHPNYNGSNTAVHIPAILIHENSRNVTATGNQTYAKPAPAVSKDWMVSTRKVNWVLSPNTILSKPK